MATAEQILNVRYEVGDVDITLPVMSDEEIAYFIDKNDGSVARATVDTAKSLLFKLSYRTDKTVDVLSLKGSDAAKNWIQALKLFIKDPSLNPLYKNLSGSWIGNTSVQEMQDNLINPDNYTTVLGTPSFTENISDNPFSV